MSNLHKHNNNDQLRKPETQNVGQGKASVDVNNADETNNNVRAFLFTPYGHTSLVLVKADLNEIKKQVMLLCPYKFRGKAEVRVVYPRAGGMAAFYTAPTKESGLGKNSRWRAKWGGAFDEYLLGPAILVAINKATNEVRDFTSKEFNRALEFQANDYCHEKMFELNIGDRIVLLKGEIDNVNKTDKIYVYSENWQILELRVEHGTSSFYVTVPKKKILTGKLEFIRYENGEPIR